MPDQVTSDCQPERSPALAPAPCSAINIIFDGPPGHESGRFVEVETDDGHGINAGEWIKRPDGLWALRITHLPNDRSEEAVASGDLLARTIARELCRAYCLGFDHSSGGRKDRQLTDAQIEKYVAYHSRAWVAKARELLRANDPSHVRDAPEPT